MSNNIGVLDELDLDSSVLESLPETGNKSFSGEEREVRRKGSNKAHQKEESHGNGINQEQPQAPTVMSSKPTKMVKVTFEMPIRSVRRIAAYLGDEDEDDAK